MCRIWLKELNKTKSERKGGARRLPLIIPLVVYAGREEWRAPLSIQDMIDAPKELEFMVESFGRILLLALDHIPPEELSRSLQLRAILIVMCVVFHEDISDEEIKLIFEGVEYDERGMYLFRYLIERANMSVERLEKGLRHSPMAADKKEEMMSTPAQEWMEQGIEKGIEQGIEQGIEKGMLAGKAETFLNLARVKFGKLSTSQVARVRNASSVDIDAWLERLITSDSIMDVFGGHRRH